VIHIQLEKNLFLKRIMSLPQRSPAAKLQGLKVVGSHGEIIAAPIIRSVVSLYLQIKADGVNHSSKKGRE
jgi:hypothetical protein